MMLDAARAFEPLDVHRARDAVFDAIQMAILFGDSSAVSAAEVAEVARSFELPAGTVPTAADLVLDAIAELIAEGYGAAAPLLRDALAAVHIDPESQVPRHLARACWIAFALSDDDTLGALAAACATASREQGAFRVLPEVLDYLGLRELRAGSLNVAEDFFAEEIELHGVLRRHSGPGEAARLMVSAWRGRETDVRAEAAELAAEARAFGLVVRWTEYAVMILELGLGNYQAASSLAWDDWNEDLLLGDLRAADAVEAHVRSGNDPAAPPALAYLAERAAANQSALDLGLLARSQALLASDSDAEAHYRESIAELDTCGARLHLARTQLVYGEWLRRQKRRRDARHSSRRHATPSSRWAPTASPTGPGSSCSRPVRVPANASTRPATTSRRRSRRSPASPPAARPIPRSVRVSSSAPTPWTTTSARCTESSTSSRDRSSPSVVSARLIGIDYAAGGFEQRRGRAQSRVATDDPHGVITLRGDGTIDQLLRRAVARIEALGLDVYAVIDHSGDAAEAGVALPETKLVLFGSAKELAELVLAHPHIAIELPLKLLICESDDGHVLISYHAPDDLAHRYGLTEEEADALRVVDAIAGQTRASANRVISSYARSIVTSVGSAARQPSAGSQRVAGSRRGSTCGTWSSAV